MKITMIPGACQSAYRQTGASYCESCFARFLMQGGDPDLACITAVADDGVEQQTLIMQSGAYQEIVLLTGEERERLAGEWRGWQTWIEQAAVPHAHT